MQSDGEVFLDEVSDGYFRTTGITLLGGREFSVFDTTKSPAVAVLNETMARKFFGGRNPVGRYLRVLEGNRLGPRVEIVGIVRDAKVGSLRESAVPALFTARRQDLWIDSYYEFELRARGAAPTALIPEVTTAVGRIDPDAVLEFGTLSRRMQDSMSRERLLAAVSGYFGLLALALALIGLYAALAYSIAKKRRDLGVRLALGATPGRVLWAVMGEAAPVVGIGLVVGLAMSLSMTQVTGSLLFGVTPNDPVTLARALALLAGAAFLASYLPARRAAQLDPLTVLREE